MNTTLNYYNKNAVSFVEGTKDVDFKTIQDRTLEVSEQDYLSPKQQNFYKHEIQGRTKLM